MGCRSWLSNILRSRLRAIAILTAAGFVIMIADILFRLDASIHATNNGLRNHLDVLEQVVNRVSERVGTIDVELTGEMEIEKMRSAYTSHALRIQADRIRNFQAIPISGREGSCDLLVLVTTANRAQPGLENGYQYVTHV